MTKTAKTYKIIRDTREQEKGNGWWFPAEGNCEGTIVGTLASGDYTVEGLEKIISIERKANTAEFAKNIFEKRFFRELDRLEEYAHSFLILQFSLDDLMRFPEGSGIPRKRWKYLKATPKLLRYKLHEIDFKYKTKIIFAPFDGYERAEYLLKFASNKYGC